MWSKRYIYYFLDFGHKTYILIKELLNKWYMYVLIYNWVIFIRNKTKKNPKNNLSQSVPLIYNRVVSISLVYNYITHNVSNGFNKKNANKRTLKKSTLSY